MAVVRFVSGGSLMSGHLLSELFTDADFKVFKVCGGTVELYGGNQAWELYPDR